MTSTPSTVTDTRTIAVVVHLAGIPFLFVPALIAFVLLEGRDPWLREQLRAALNFQLTALGAYLIGFVTLWFVVGFLVLPVVAAAAVVLSVVCALQAYRGEPARYVLTLPFVS